MSLRFLFSSLKNTGYQKLSIWHGILNAKGKEKKWGEIVVQTEE